MRRPALVAGLAVLATAAPAVPAAASPESRLLSRINAYRESQGVHPLRLSTQLTASSSRYARGLMRRDRFAHASSIQADGRWRSLGEVLALRYRHGTGGRWPLSAWKRSPGHNSVLLGSGYRRIGIGRAVGRYDGRPATIWTVQVGRR